MIVNTKTVKIERINKTDEFIEGKLYLNDVFICDTLELPWRDNQQNVSCIPAGEYKLHQRKVGKYYTAYNKRWAHEFALWIRGVDGREYILIHTGNTVRDTRGCILVGVKAGDGVLTQSRDMYRKLYTKLFARWGRLEESKPVVIIEVDSEAEFSVGDRAEIKGEDL